MSSHTSESLTDHLINHPPLKSLWLQSTRLHPFLASLASNKLKPEQFDRWLVQDYIFALYPFTYQFKILHSLVINHINSITPPAGTDSSSSQATYEDLKSLVEAGIASAAKEVDFFKELAQKRGLALPDTNILPQGKGEPHKYFLNAIHPDSPTIAISTLVSPELRAYSEFLLSDESLIGRESGSGSGEKRRGLEELALVLWVLEKCYLDAWRYIAASLAKLPDEQVDPTIKFCCGWWVNDKFKEYVEELGRCVDWFASYTDTLQKWRAELVCKQVLELEVGFWGMAFGGKRESGWRD